MKSSVVVLAWLLFEIYELYGMEHVIEHSWSWSIVDSLVMVDLALKASTADHSERERAKTKTNVFTIKNEAVLFQEQTMPRSRESYNKMSFDFPSEQYIYGTRMRSNNM